MELQFWKYEGAGNDFILIDGRSRKNGKHTAAPAKMSAEISAKMPTEMPAETIRTLCERHTGIGADGLMILGDEPGSDFRMEY